MTFFYYIRKIRKFFENVFAVGKWRKLSDASIFIYFVTTIFSAIVGLFIYAFLSYILEYPVFPSWGTMSHTQGMILLTVVLGMFVIDFLMGTFFVFLFDKLIFSPTANIVGEIQKKTEDASNAFPQEMRQLVEDNPFIQVSSTGTWVDSVDRYITIAGNEKYFDETTGCFNRKYFQQVLSNMLKTEMLCDIKDSESKRIYGSSMFAIFMIDIDHFKYINDDFGHQYGDVILALVGKTLRKIVGSKGVVVRNGGEEFLIIACMQYPESIEDYAEHIREVFAKNVKITGHGDKNRPVTCSIGYTPFPLFDAKPTAITVDDHVNLADQAMYLSKTSGRNTWRGLQVVRPPYNETEISKLVGSIEYGEKSRYIKIISP